MDRRHWIVARDALVGCDLLVPPRQQFLLEHGLVCGRSRSLVYQRHVLGDGRLFGVCCTR